MNNELIPHFVVVVDVFTVDHICLTHNFCLYAYLTALPGTRGNNVMVSIVSHHIYMFMLYAVRGDNMCGLFSTCGNDTMIFILSLFC